MILLFGMGFCGGLALFWVVHRVKTGGFHQLAQQMVHKAELEIKELEFEEKRYLDNQREIQSKKDQQEKDRLTLREEKLETRTDWVEKQRTEIEKKQTQQRDCQKLIDQKTLEIEALEVKILSQLEQISDFTAVEAKKELLSNMEQELAEESAQLIMRMKEEMQHNAQKEAASIIATSINRITHSCVSDNVVTTIGLPNAEMKGRIIGREGRNIRSLEQATGVNIVIDETPNAVVISGFDPVRKHIAKTALAELIQDGRIHPTRIEEVVAKITGAVEKEIVEFGQRAAAQAGVHHLPLELLKLLGQLHFRYSGGQNVLKHSIEVSLLMGSMASELQIDQDSAKRMGLLHDIGKGVSIEAEGSHAIVGYEMALRYGENEKVANGIGCHHNEMSPISIEGSLVSAADALSGGRVGARNEDVEKYLRRIHRLEKLSSQHEGVEKAYAIQAGREIRVIVAAEKISDSQTTHLARQLAKKIETELTYPGKIKVTVIREKRVVEYAT